MEDWQYSQRVLRDYSGMSLRGLVWTAPQGFILHQLGFGWQYGLSGSLMGTVYYIGSQTGIDDDNGTGGENEFFDSTTSYSEYVWGSWVWFVLLVSCLSQLIHRVRGWVYRRSSPLLPTNPVNPHSRYNTRLYESLNHPPCDVIYNVLFLLLWAVFSASLVFYSLVNQSDVRNKAQTFFGLAVSTLSLTFSIGWRWGSCYQSYREGKGGQDGEGSNSLVQVTPVTRRQRQHLCRTTNNDLERGGVRGGETGDGETDPLLPWPYSHPDKAYANRRSPVPCDSLPLSSTNSAYSPVFFSSRTAVNNRRRTRRRSGRFSSLSLNLVLIWAFLEKWVWLDLFALCRHFIGLLSLLAMVTTIVTTSIAFAWDLGSPRYYDISHNVTCLD